MKQMYSRADVLLEKMWKYIRREFNRLGMISIDELNVLNTRQTTSDMYQRLKDLNQQCYLDAAEHAVKHAEVLIKEADIDVEGSLFEPTLIWLMAFLAKYNHSTGYLYESETDRKMMRLNEGILTAREYLDRELYNKAVQSSAKLWWKQSQQYMIDVVDEATVETYKARGVEYVMWITEKDDRVCSECKELNGQIFAIDEVPEKPHQGCRCWLKPVKKP